MTIAFYRLRQDSNTDTFITQSFDTLVYPLGAKIDAKAGTFQAPLLWWLEVAEP